jgi:hypothetical protein
VECGASLVVAARRSGEGKTTLLSSLLDAIPEGKTRVWVRGRHDRIERNEGQPQEQVLLVNEIGPDLATYCWGASLGRVIDLTLRGAQLLTTIHAATAGEIVARLHVLHGISVPGYGVFLESPASSAASHSIVRRIEALATQNTLDVSLRTSIPAAELARLLPMGISVEMIRARSVAIEQLCHTSPLPDNASFARTMRSLRHMQ